MSDEIMNRKKIGTYVATVAVCVPTGVTLVGCVDAPDLALEAVEDVVSRADG